MSARTQRAAAIRAEFARHVAPDDHPVLAAALVTAIFTDAEAWRRRALQQWRDTPSQQAARLAIHTRRTR